MPDDANLRSGATPAVADACLVCRAVQQDMEQVRRIVKDDNSPVTVADFASQAVVAHTIRDITGQCVMVGEETSGFLRNPEHTAELAATLAAAQEVWGDAEQASLLEAIDLGAAEPNYAGFWTLDPIDGTKGFLRGQQYAVCLAYIERGEPVIGVLGCPNLPRDFGDSFDDVDPEGCLYTCIKGQGIFELPADDPSARPISITRLPHREGEPVSVASSLEESHTSSERVAAVLAKAGERGMKFREPARLDSQCKYAVVARGQADAYIRLPTRKGYVERIWDHAAGALLCAEVGCAVTDALGEPLDFSCGRGLEKNRGILAAPPAVHGVLLGAIKDVGI
jgi:3'(2'), 5'-bisphosphate nucleotidase